MRNDDDDLEEARMQIGGEEAWPRKWQSVRTPSQKDNVLKKHQGNKLKGKCMDKHSSMSSE